ncbi:hypothetical protein HDU97_002996 [Phlyctochytrium planicorne]|nr:hypothetical protein HDU97_002996 [Phlyctochytrium planicorne]
MDNLINQVKRSKNLALVTPFRDQHTKLPSILELIMLAKNRNPSLLELPVTITYAIRKSPTKIKVSTKYLNATTEPLTQKPSRIIRNEDEVVRKIKEKAALWTEVLRIAWLELEDVGKELSRLERRFGTKNEDRGERFQNFGSAVVDGGSSEKCLVPPSDQKKHPWFPRIRFRAVDFAELEFDEQVAVAQQTDIFVGTHGAHFIHLLYLRKAPVAAAIELQPPKRSSSNLQFRNLAMGIGHIYSRIPVANNLIADKEAVYDVILRAAAAVFRQRLQKLKD